MLGNREYCKVLYLAAAWVVIILVFITFMNMSSGRHLQCREPEEYSEETGRYSLNCSNMHEVTIKGKLGKGHHKIVYEGVYKNVSVAVKYIDKHGIIKQKCLRSVKRLNEKNILTTDEFEELYGVCYDIQDSFLVKEILLLQELRHPLIMPMVGFCFQNREDRDENGAFVVVERGTKKHISKYIPYMNWKDRIRCTMDVAEFLVFLDTSPIGSIAITYFRPSHFILHNGRFRWIDLDRLVVIDQLCDANCPADLKCIDNVCLGKNARHNIRMLNEKLFPELLNPRKFPNYISRKLQHVLRSIEKNEITGAKLFDEMKTISEMKH